MSAEHDHYTTEIADLMLQGDRNLEKIYKNSLVCTGLVGTGVVILLCDLLFLSISNRTGLIIYYISLFSLLGILFFFLYLFYEYSRKTAEIDDRMAVARKRLLEDEELMEFRAKIRKRMERMRSELAWFKQLLSPGALEKMDSDRSDNRGNEEFEYFVRKFFEKMGFRLERSSVVTDSGVFMLMVKDKEKYLVFPIHPPQKVDQNKLKELNRELLSNNISSALVVTTGSFSDSAREFIKKRSFLLYDKAAILDGIRGIISVLNTRIQEEKDLLTEDKPLEKISTF